MESSQPDVPPGCREQGTETPPPHSPLPKPQTGASKGKCLLSPLLGEGLDREIRMVSEKGACTVLRAEAGFHVRVLTQ